MEKDRAKTKDGKKNWFSRIFRKNQILIAALALMIGLAGYLNFAGNKDKAKETSKYDFDLSYSDLGEENADDLIGMEELDADALRVSNDYIDTELAYYENGELIPYTDLAVLDVADLDVYEDDSIDEVPGEAVFTSSANTASLIDAKLLKEQTRAKNKEILMEIVNNTTVDEVQKKDALDSIVAMTDRSEREMNAEILLEAKGFKNAVVSITGDTADVCVAVENMNDILSAQIMDIVKRKTGIAPEKIVISAITP